MTDHDLAQRHGVDPDWSLDQISQANGLCRKLGGEARNKWKREKPARLADLRTGGVLRRWLRGL